MVKDRRKTEVFETTLGELIAALLEAAGEVSSNSAEIGALAHETLASLLSPGSRISSSDKTRDSLIGEILENNASR
jgi:hypothetical protein